MLKNLFVSGYRSYELGIFQDNDPKINFIKLALKERILTDLDRGLKWVLIGGQLGTETWAGEVVQELKTEGYDLQLALILPFEGFSNNRNEKNQARFYQLKEMADFVLALSPGSYQNPSQFRNHQKFMVEHTQKALMFYDLEFEGKSQYDYQYILNYQEKENYDLECISMFDLQDLVEQEEMKRMDED